MFRHAFEYDFPVTIGRDYAGVVQAVGDAVTRVRPGDSVFGYLGGQKLHRGSYAELLWVEEDECFVPKPGELLFEQAACLPLLWRRRVAMRCGRDADGQRCRRGGGSAGGVGSFAVQLALRLGATVVASGPDQDRDYLLSLGAASVVEPGPGSPRRSERYTPRRLLAGSTSYIPGGNSRGSSISFVLAVGWPRSIVPWPRKTSSPATERDQCQQQSGPRAAGGLGSLAADGELTVPVERVSTRSRMSWRHWQLGGGVIVTAGRSCSWGKSFPIAAPNRR